MGGRTARMARMIRQCMRTTRAVDDEASGRRIWNEKRINGLSRHCIKCGCHLSAESQKWTNLLLEHEAELAIDVTPQKASASGS